MTSAFNKNLLNRVNKEFDSKIDLDLFQHEARYNEVFHRVEMHLVSKDEQTISIADRDFKMKKGGKYSHRMLSQIHAIRFC